MSCRSVHVQADERQRHLDHAGAGELGEAVCADVDPDRADSFASFDLRAVGTTQQTRFQPSVHDVIQCSFDVDV